MSDGGVQGLLSHDAIPFGAVRAPDLPDPIPH